MEGKFPKRIFGRGEEPQVEQINNSCKVALLKLLEEKLPAEYNEVSTKSVFADILALRSNNLGYSARLVHSMLCKQLITTKQHELWFVFGGMPLRFSLQEFHAVTGLNSSIDPFTSDLDDWEDDKGFWAEVLKKKTKISILDLKRINLEATTLWESKVIVCDSWFYVG